MFAPLLLLAQIGATQSISWHLLPMALVISLVYSASRFEIPEVILRRALRLFTTIMIFMGAVFLLLWVLSGHL